MKLDLDKANNAEDIKILKDFLRVRVPLAVKLFKQYDTQDTNFINIDQLKEMILNFKLPPKFQHESVLNPLIEKYKNLDDTTSQLINYKKLIEDIVDIKELNDFFNFKDKHIEKIESKIQNSKDKMIESYNLIKQEELKKHSLMKELERNAKLHAEAKLKQKDLENKYLLDKHPNSLQPSKELNEIVFKDIKQHSDKYKEFESKFSAHPSLRKEVIVQTRYGANPVFQNTKWITQPVSDSGMFLSERDRFSKNNHYFQEQEKHLRTNKHLNKINLIKYYNDENENKKNMENMLKDQKKLYSLLQRTEKMHKYEMINKIRNDLVE
jgi:hypothetical protein